MNPMCVPPDQVKKLWPLAWPMIDQAYSEVDEEAPVGLLDDLANGRLLLWVSVREEDVAAVLITALVPRPSGLTCRLMIATGVGAGEWAAWHERIESYARAEGCVKLMAEGRPGWGRVLPGYTTKRIILEKRL